jgi:hypothetical protein
MQTTFETRVNGLPCIAEVTYYEGTNFRINSTSLEPNDHPELIELTLLDRKGYRAKWLERYLTPEIQDQLLYEALEH